MGIEIERKFLVQGNQWKSLATGSYYRQGYLVGDPNTTVRVRIAGELGFLTIKGRVKNLSRPEFEYEIPIDEARQMLDLWCGNQVIEKNRYCIHYQSLIWEVDEFLGANAGLVIAEVELESADQEFNQPDWVGHEVSEDVRYYNSYLVKHPYRTWHNS